MDTSRLAQTFTQSLTVQLRRSEGVSLPVESELAFDSGNPYALTISFHLTETVVWTFGRELLGAGLTEPSGDGDVHVWPCLDDRGLAVLCVELCSPDGNALIEMSTADAADFVDRSEALVPLGSESEHLDVDAIINAIRTAENA
jgi:hypothetical protein